MMSNMSSTLLGSRRITPPTVVASAEGTLAEATVRSKDCGALSGSVSGADAIRARTALPSPIVRSDAANVIAGGLATLVTPKLASMTIPVAGTVTVSYTHLTL